MSEQTAKSSLGIVPSVHSRLLLVMVFCRICSPNLREKAPSQKNHLHAPLSKAGPLPLSMARLAGLPDLPLHWWRGWMSNSLLGNPNLSGERQRL